MRVFGRSAYKEDGNGMEAEAINELISTFLIPTVAFIVSMIDMGVF